MIRIKKDLGRINPRFAAPTDTKQINFNRRTLNRLFYAWRYGLLDEGHLQELLGGYGRHVHRELELTRAGLIYHPEAQIPLRSICTNITWITALTDKGVEALVSKGYNSDRIDPTHHRERYRRHKAFNSLLHDLSRSDYLVDMDIAAKAASPDSNKDCLKNGKNPSNEVGGASVVQLSHQDELFDQPYTQAISILSIVEWKHQHKPVAIEPDGLFSLTFSYLPKNRSQKYFALEIDQDTESNMRYKKFWQYKSIIKTMISYAEAHKRGIVEDTLGLTNLRTIFVTTTEKHIHNILKDAATYYITKGYAPNLCLFVSWEQLGKNGVNALNAKYVNAAGSYVQLDE